MAFYILSLPTEDSTLSFYARLTSTANHTSLMYLHQESSHGKHPEQNRNTFNSNADQKKHNKQVQIKQLAFEHTTHLSNLQYIQ